MTTGPATETILYEQIDRAPGPGPATFITVLSTSPGNGLQRRESHVLLPASEVHLHEIVYSYPTTDDDSPPLKAGSCATQQLFADHLARHPIHRRFAAGSADAGLTYRTTVLDEPPFRSFRHHPFLVRTMRQIQDLTHSDRLRTHLRHAMRIAARPWAAGR